MATRGIRMAVAALLAGLLVQSFPSTVAEAQTGACTVRGPAQQYVATIDDFGPRGGSYTIKEEADYWAGHGFLVGFQRGEWEASMSHPWGSYLWAGVVIAESDGDAANDLRNAVNGWTEKWSTSQRVTAPAVGDEAVAVSRLTTWEVAQDQPMVETFLAFRRCNATAHFLLATMPEFDPVAQAVRYARLVDTRMRR